MIAIRNNSAYGDILWQKVAEPIGSRNGVRPGIGGILTDIVNRNDAAGLLGNSRHDVVQVIDRTYSTRVLSASWLLEAGASNRQWRPTGIFGAAFERLPYNRLLMSFQSKKADSR